MDDFAFRRYFLCWPGYQQDESFRRVTHFAKMNGTSNFYDGPIAHYHLR